MSKVETQSVTFDRDDVQRAILHLAKLGDSDIVPSLPEYIFFSEESDKLVDQICSLTLGNYVPKSAIELLSPKSEFGFRIAHQLSAFDNLVYLAASLSCARAIEGERASRTRAFSYRYEDDLGYLIFSKECSFHNWLELNKEKVGLKQKIRGVKWVVQTDISDFYHRINYHRIENALDDYGCPRRPRSFILKIIKKIRAEQSFGLPVGASASRIIAEGVMIDTDKLMEGKGWESTRFVDDIRMFFKEKAEAQSALGELAQHLMVTEGLSLNSSKTKILTVGEFAADMRLLTEDIFSKDESAELDHLFRISYGEEVERESDRENYSADDIIEKLHSITSTVKDVSKIRAVLRAFRVYPIPNLIEFLDEFSELFMIAPRDMSLAIWESMDQYGFLASSSEEEEVTEYLIALLTASPYKDMPIVRVWILELFARGVLQPTNKVVVAAQRHDLNGLERRQLLLIRGWLKDKAYFRSLKTQFSELSDWEKPVAMWAASCLPADEYEKWITFAKGLLPEAYSSIYAKWLIEHQNDLFDKLQSSHITGAEQPSDNGHIGLFK